MAAVLEDPELTRYSLTSVWKAQCMISPQCSKQSTPECSLADLHCVASHDCSFKDSKYFDSHCLYEQCTATEARIGFLGAFITACGRHDEVVSSIPQEWIPFLLPPSNSLQSVAANHEPGPPTAGRPSSSDQSSTSTNITTPTINSTSSTMTQAVSVTNNVANPTSTTSWADVHKPICGITEKCLVNQERNDPCKLENLQCVCKYSNSIARSTYFLPDCLWADCYTEIGRREWLDAFAYACYKVNKNVVDIPETWDSLLPSWYLLTPSSVSTPSVTAEVTTAAPSAAITAPNTRLSEGAIAGVSIGSFLALAFLALCGWTFYRNNQKLKRVSREKAQMADALNRHGVQNRIDELRYGHDRSDENLNTMPSQASGTFNKPTEADHQEQEQYTPQQPLETSLKPLSPAPPYQSPPRHPLSILPHQYPTRHPSRQEQLHHANIPHPLPLLPSSFTPTPHNQGVARHPPHHPHLPAPTSQNSPGTTVVTPTTAQQYEAGQREGWVIGSARPKVPKPVYDEHGRKITSH
ncbi:hypothetical protein BDU57DRAFT_135969 [Ampelomyces quisqualis]|uniref:Uncharacterized protein n=1 Tax=Ampelomyces quisqualis TaxID=50730 RepID=A0A6A5QXK3_AMPQU|nr:hypothetical protein BDU57DRAFT_135969 [Ampelomyces quisqualis]